MFLNPPVDAVRFSASWLVKAHTLSLIRAVISLYVFVSIVTKLSYYSVHEPANDGQDFSYFTSLTFWGLGFYFAVGALHAGTYWWTGKPALARWGAVLQALHSILYSTIAVFPLIVTLVYWGLIYDGFDSTFKVWSNVSQHALNTVFCLTEIVLARTEPLPWIHILWLIIILCLYLGVAFITFATENFYVYAFLDDRKKGGRGRVAAYIFGILVVAVIAFIIVRYLILLRQWITETKPKMTGKLENKRAREHEGRIDGLTEVEK